MTVVVIVFLPFVLAYQAWTYDVFRRRISKQEFQPQAPVTRAGDVDGQGSRSPGMTAKQEG
jgi:cytochrome bd ubiquinol oxidase subunit II